MKNSVYYYSFVGLILLSTVSALSCNIFSARQILQSLYISTGGENWKNKWDIFELDICKYPGISCEDGSLDLSGYNLVGNLPDLFWCLDIFSRIDLSGNPRLNGNITAMMNLHNVHSLSVAESNLYGELPDFSKFQSKRTLSRLDLSQTCVSGSVNDSIRHLTKLTSLRAPRTLLSGNLSRYLYDLPIKVLDLSCNLINSTDFDFENFRSLKNLTKEAVPDITYSEPGHPCLNQYPYSCNLTLAEDRDPFCDFVLHAKLHSLATCYVNETYFFAINKTAEDVEFCQSVGHVVTSPDYSRCFFHLDKPLALPQELCENCTELICQSSPGTGSVVTCTRDVVEAFDCVIHGGRILDMPLFCPTKHFCDMCWAHQNIGLQYTHQVDTITGPVDFHIDDCYSYCPYNYIEYFEPFLSDELVKECNNVMDSRIFTHPPNFIENMLCLNRNLTFSLFTPTNQTTEDDELLQFVYKCIADKGLAITDCDYCLGKPAQAPSLSTCMSCHEVNQLFCEETRSCATHDDARDHCSGSVHCCGSCPTDSLTPSENYYAQCPVATGARELLIEFYSLYDNWPPGHNWRDFANYCDFKGVDCEKKTLTLQNLPITLKSTSDPANAGRVLMCLTRYLPHISAAHTKLSIQLPKYFGPFVKTLLLRDSATTGEIPYSLYCSSLLKYLDLSLNDIYGVVPYGIGELSHLQSLDLYKTKIEGILPVSLYNMKFLQFVDVRGTNVKESTSGGFSFEEFQNITDVTCLYDVKIITPPKTKQNQKIVRDIL